MDHHTTLPESLRYHRDQEQIAFKQELFMLCVEIKAKLSNKGSKNNKNRATEANPICMAMTISIFENKIAKNEKISLSYSEIASLLYNAFCEGAVKSSLLMLIEAKFINRCRINGKKPNYELNIPVLQKSLDAQASKDQVQLVETTSSTKQLLFNEKQLEAIGHATKRKFTEVELEKLTENELKTRLTPKMREAFNNWCSIQKGYVKLIPKRFLAFQELEERDADVSLDTFDAIIKFCYEMDTPKLPKYPKGYYHTRGVDVWDVAERYPLWDQTREYQVRSPVLTITKIPEQTSQLGSLVSAEQQNKTLKKQVHIIMEKRRKEGKNDIPDYFKGERRTWAEDWEKEQQQKQMETVR